jgi:hypothetical protein
MSTTEPPAAPPAAEGASPRRRRIRIPLAPRLPRQRLGPVALRLAFELLVVFAGVYGAFMAENYREGRERRAAAREIHAALIEELDDHIEGVRFFTDSIAAMQTRWEEAHARGERPIPWYLPRLGRPPVAAWEATLASGGVTLIDRKLFYRLAKHYDGMHEWTTLDETFRGFAEQRIIPRIDDGPDAFYRPGTGELRAEYRDYLDRWNGLLERERGRLERLRELQVDLQRRAEGL